MGLETVSTPAKIGELDKNNPASGDPVNRGDDHIRNVKKVIKETFSGIDAEGADAVPVTAESAELNILDGATLTTDELNILDGVTATAEEINVLDGISEDLEAADLNILDGVTATTDELNYVAGVTSAIQDQIDDKQDELTAGDNITINAVTVDDVTTTTISANALPFVTVQGFDNRVRSSSNVYDRNTFLNGETKLPLTDILFPDANTSSTPSVPTGVSINSSDKTLNLPEGTYYAKVEIVLNNNTDESMNENAHTGSPEVQCTLKTSSGTTLSRVVEPLLYVYDMYNVCFYAYFTIGSGGDSIGPRVNRLIGNSGLRYGEELYGSDSDAYGCTLTVYKV